MSGFFWRSKPYENLLLCHPEGREWLRYNARWQGTRQWQHGKEADIKNTLPDRAVPEEAEIGHPRTATNAMGTASTTNERLSVMPSHRLDLSFPHSRKWCQHSPLLNTPWDAVLLSGKKNMRKGEILCPKLKEILSSQAYICFSVIPHYLWM